VVVTWFDCRTIRNVLRILVLHYLVKPEVRREADGYLGGKTIVAWRRRAVLSISMWRDLPSLYQMGKVDRHIRAARVPARLGVTTSCGIYTYRDEWKHLMFSTPDTDAPEPLHMSIVGRPHR
jgi:hypothetical protein